MLKRNQILLLIAAVIIFVIAVPDKIWAAPAAGIYFLCLYYIRERFIIIFSIISFLTLTSTINPGLRLLVQVLNLVSLLYLFLKDQDLRRPVFIPVPKKFLGFIAFTVVWMIISSMFSLYTKEGFEQVFRTIVFLPIIYLFYSNIKSINEVRVILYSLIAVAVFYSLFLFYELYKNNFVLISVEEQLSYVFGMHYLDKNFLGGFISIAILFLVSYLFKGEKKKRIFIVTALFICVMGVLLSNSRAAIIALLISGFILLWINNRKIFYKGLVVLSFFLLVFFLSPLSDYFIVYARLESMSSGRDYLITAAGKVIENHFLLGAGPSATRFEMYNHLPFMLGSPEEMFIRKNFYQSELGQAHSFYLFYFTDLGITGLFLSIIFPAIYFTFSIRTLKYFNDKSTEEYFITRGIFAAGVLMFTRGILEWGGIFTFGNINQDLPFWLILSILIYYYLKTEPLHLHK